MNLTAPQLFDLLNQQDECPWIEAKGENTCSHSVMETVCAYCNEPGLGGGYILMGIAVDETALFPQYRVSGVSLNEEDVNRLGNFDYLGLNDAQKQALIFVREAGAIDNQTYRQMADCDILKTSAELRTLKNAELVDSKGRGKATYYIPGSKLIPLSKNISTQPASVSAQPNDLSTQPPFLSEELLLEISKLKQKEHDAEKVKHIIIQICSQQPMTSESLAKILNRREDYLRRKYLQPLIEQKMIRFLYPEMINHPNQAYLTIK